MVYLACVAAAAVDSTPFAFDRAPVLVRESPTTTTHAWFPEGGAVIGSGSPEQAVVVSIRYCADGGEPLPGHDDKSLVSRDGRSSHCHLSYTSTYLTGTYLDHSGTLHDHGMLHRGSNN
eukprot:SAG31_NODE_19507_length_600_cov_0.524950_1_plen_118_part_10